MTTDIIVPKMGQTVETCQLLEWFVQQGDTVTEGDPMFAIETDKASFDIEAPVSGIVKELLVEAGQTVSVMSVIGVIENA